jgi:hypothetical protein
MEKICYTVVMSVRKHTIKVLMNQPLSDIFGNRDNSGWISKWAVELLEYVVDFKKRSAIKSQILANFVAEWMEPSSQTEGIVPESPLLVYCNGAWGSARAGTAIVLISPSGIKLRYEARL